MMKDNCCFGLLVGLFLVFATHFGCAPVEVQRPPEDFEPTCIQGTVWYRTPDASSPVPYPYARITAWRHGTEQPLAETKAGEAGSYCIEVPLGERVDFRIWGLQRLRGMTYTCKGSEEAIDPGTTSEKCGEDCLTIDIMTDCGEFQPLRRY